VLRCPRISTPGSTLIESNLYSHELEAASERPLRIALFTETFLPKIDGVVTRLCQTIKHLVRFGHEVLLVAPDGGLTEYEGARVHGVKGFSFPLYPEIKLAIPRPSIGKALEDFKPDLIHGIHPVVLGVSAFHYSKRHSVPLLVSYHAQLDKYLHYYGFGKLEPLFWKGTRSAYNVSDLALATSQAMVDLLRQQGLKRVELWQKGVDTETFSPDKASPEMRERLTQGHPQDKLMVYIGRLSAEKGIEACRPVLQAIRGLRLALIGDGPHREKLKEYFAGTPTYFPGFLQGKDLAAAYASADIFFMASRTETLGLVVLEAMAAGCAVVAANAGGIPDIVRDGLTGHLFEPDDQESAIAAVRKVMTDDAHREQVRREARIDAERWSWAAATRQLERLYGEVLNREQELSNRIAEYSRNRASEEQICGALDISKTTLRRQMRLRASRQLSGQNA
jgi:glycosyltransferase involved in cell wall biosynthesis